jgi:KDO2-lipid IV(A) lauroyltransferase
VPFFGRPALTPIGPAKLAIRAGSIVLGCFNQRIDGRHHIHFEAPIVTERGDDPVEVTARMTTQIEGQIRRAPEQWVWMHDRWRARPKWDIATRA